MTGIGVSAFENCTALLSVTNYMKIASIAAEPITWSSVSGIWSQSVNTYSVDGYQYTSPTNTDDRTTRIRCSFKGYSRIKFRLRFQGYYNYLNIGNLDGDCTRESYLCSLSGYLYSGKWDTYTCEISDPQNAHYVEFCYSKSNSQSEASDYAEVYVEACDVDGLTITLKPNVIDAKAFKNCSSLKTINIPHGLSILREETFSGCTSLANIVLPATLLQIENNVFANTGLTQIIIPSKTAIIGNGVFGGCGNLKKVIFENSNNPLALGYQTSGQGMFYKCPIEDVYVGRNLIYETGSSYGYSPFYANKSLKKITFGDLPTQIYTNEFYECSSLTDVSIGDGLTSIGEYAFSRCVSIESFSFGESLQTIGAEAFSDCTAMTALYAKSVIPPTCGTQALDDINKWECTLYVQPQSKNAYQNAEQWKEFFSINGSLSTTTPGDANGDGNITMSDVVSVINYIMETPLDGFTFDAADMNGDSRVTLADVVLLIDNILEKTSSQSAPRRVSATYEPGELYAADYDNESLTLGLSNATSMTAVQMDFNLPEGVEIEDVTVPSKHTASWTKLESGKTRLIIYSPSNRHFSDVNIADIRFTGNTADKSISVEDISECTVNGTEYSLSDLRLGSVTSIRNHDGKKMVIKVEGNNLVVEACENATISIANISGQSILWKVAEGRNVHMLNAGVYIINGKKYVVK